MRRRKIKAFIAELPRFILLCPLCPIMFVLHFLKWLLLITSVAAKCGKIRIITVAPAEEDEQTFVAVTRRALALVERYDARRYALLQKELRFIENVPMTSFGLYDHHFHRCVVDLSHLDFDWEDHDTPNYANHYSWYVAQYAAIIIHEATHGRLERCGFPYNKRNRLQIERICVAEQQRFATRLPQTPYNFARDLITPFDPARWDYSWNTPRLQQAKDGWQRAMRQIRQKDKNG